MVTWPRPRSRLSRVTSDDYQVYVLHVLTHQECDRMTWKED